MSIPIPDISTLPLFENVEQQFIDEIGEGHSIIVYPAKSTLIQKNKLNDKVFIVLQGEMAVYVDDLGIPIRTLREGSAFGEVSALDAKPATASVIAVCESRVLALREDDLWRLCEKSHAFTTNVLKLFVVNIRRFSMQLDDSIDNVKDFKHKSRMDSLTGLFNRRWLDEKFSTIVKQCHIKNVALNYLMLDIDHFKEINDTYGHDAGDAVLKQVGAILLTYVRERDYAVRYGGDEICLILSETELNEVSVIAERLRLTIENKTFHYAAGKSLNITISIGISSLVKNDELSDLMKRADTALYQAKSDGRNRVSVHLQNNQVQ